MKDESQAKVIAFLRQSELFVDDPEAIEEVTTHISHLLLGHETAVKLKRALKRPYVDFSTPALRLGAAEREVELNRRTAPHLYRGVRRITREASGDLALDGAGELADVVVEMARFDEDTLFDRMAVAGTLTDDLIESLARQIAEFHRDIEAMPREDGAAHMAGVLDVNEAALAGGDVFAEEAVESFNARFRRKHAQLADLLDRRGREGMIRRCHGDLHLRNICLVDGEPTVFDCLEFDEDLGTTDLLYDLAFLLMDLWHRDLRSHANLVLNRYLDLTGDEGGLPLVPYFMAVRAAVRAHVAATASVDMEDGAAEKRDEAKSYFDLALTLLDDKAPLLVAVGGLSGSGKSTVARMIAPEIGPAPGARTLSSDRLRKARYGVSPQTRLGAEAYAREVTAAVYRDLFDHAVAITEGGHAVVADATFSTPPERSAIEAAAIEAGVPFRGIWLDVPAEELLRRVGARSGDPSDATPDVVRRQLERATGAIGWSSVDGEGSTASVRDRVLSKLEKTGDETAA
ncbi:bifunctional aminoglycoside phosphotransferase/ATP-binding protein [Jiella pacifica]|uniref:AAA family ATPase n=1 Tax=Jiella pacifica TaxID=2696469 RepID=A0A6N9T270_9HYPH|nr:bifunctional aminoglycoside phosphotransferase/ATP-binding protein [Jiella pacifica]NDW05454.1 AAA family ATPase [Jiella pacifica]